MYDRLKEKLSEFENKLAQCEVERDIRKAQRQQELNQLQENFEKRTNALISKIDDLKRKESIMLILLKISPEVPKNFPKNYCCKVVYEDEVHTGNHKLLDFEDTIINDKFILPLLLTTTVRVEIWTVEEEATLVDSG